jgi:hypothetical protein
MERERASSQAIQTIRQTCGNCAIMNSCLFGKPATETIDNQAFSLNEIMSIVPYLWVKYIRVVETKCPQPSKIQAAINKIF